jgi:glyoxylate reductase
MTDRPSVLLTRRLPEEVMSFLEERTELIVHPEDRPIPREALLRDAAGREGILSMLTDRIDEEVLDAAGGRLRVVSNYAVGYDNVDVAACTARGVLVTNTPDVLTAATADIAWALILGASRRVVEGDRLIRGRTSWSWAPTFLLGREVSGKVLGVVGFGRIGQAVAARGRAFDMEVVYASRTPRPDLEEATGARRLDLERLTREADIISVHVPLTEDTRHLFDEGRLRAMKPTAVLVNTARGPIVDEAALARALREGAIFAAGLDVYEREPEVHPDLLDVENVVLAPHLGSATVETRTEMGMLAARNLLEAVSGRRPPALLNPEAEKP